MNRAGSHGRDDAAREEKAGAGPRAEAQAWLLLLTSGRATEADAEDFQRWRRADPGNEAAFAEQQGLWRALGPALMEESAARARAPERRPAMGRRAFLGSAVAASAAYLALRPPLGLWPGIGELAADYRTARGEQRRLTLGDALDVQMNTLTRINVTVGADGAKLIELADGEAEVRAGAEPALVVAGAGRILARDASFNLRYVDGEARLCCLSGMVRLTHAQGVFDLGAQRSCATTAGAYSRRRRWIRIASLPGGRAGWCSTSSPCPRWWMS